MRRIRPRGGALLFPDAVLDEHEGAELGLATISSQMRR